MTVDAEWPRLKKEIAWLNVSLSAVRDSDVVANYARRKRYRAWAQRMGGQNLDEHRMRDHRRLVGSLRSIRFQRLIKGVSVWIERGPWLERSKQDAGRKPAKLLKTYSEQKFDRWYKRLIRKGRRLAAMDASRRHRLRIKVKRYRYMLETLTDIFPVRDHSKLRRAQSSAKRLQRTLGDLRDLKRFGRASTVPSPPDDGKHSNDRPPGYRKRKKELLTAALAAYRGLKQA